MELGVNTKFFLNSCSFLNVLYPCRLLDAQHRTGRFAQVLIKSADRLPAELAGGKGAELGARSGRRVCSDPHVVIHVISM